MKKEIIKWLDNRIIYHISESMWIIHIQYVPKKGGMIVIKNEKNELILTRFVIGLRIRVDYIKLNKATIKYHLSLSFINPMLDGLARKEYYCFLDGYSRYNQIAIAPKYKEKTKFTCSCVTISFWRISFGLLNGPITFQRCMMVILLYM